MAGVACTARKRDDAPDARRSTGASPQTPHSDSQSHLNQETRHTFGDENGYVTLRRGNQNAYTNQDSDTDKDQDSNADQNALTHAYSIEKKPPPSQ